MSGRKKEYLYSGAPLTNYVKKKIKLKIKNLEVKGNDVLVMDSNCIDDHDQISESDAPVIHSNLIDDQNAIPPTDESVMKNNLLDEQDETLKYGDTRMEISYASNEDNLQVDSNNRPDEYEYSSDDEILRILEENAEGSSNNTKFFSDSQFFESVGINVNTSPAELLLMTLKFAISHKLSIQGITNLLKFVNRIVGKKIVPESKYYFDQLCNHEIGFTLYAVCPTCTMNLGTFAEFSGLIKCKNCNTSVDISNPSNSCYFAIIDPSNAVRNYLELHENYYDYVVSQRVHETNVIEDIYDGECYRQFLNNLNDNDRHAYVTSTFNTDGAPVFESSNVSIWPIYIMLNEIPIAERYTSTVVTGLWFGRSKPEMSVFLDAFVEEMNHLSIIGISTTIKNEKRKIKLFPLVACVDTVARAPMNGTSAFNAKYGCDWCLHPGKFYGGSMRYPFIFPFPEERSIQSMIRHSTEAVRTKNRVFGVWHASPLLTLRNFDIVNGFTPDYMHCILAGVASQITDEILKSITMNDIQYMDQLLMSIKAPHVIKRLSRPLSDRSNWKATEWENWLLFYSIPVFSSVLKNKRILEHWSLLVESLWLCLNTKISYSELNHANEMLHKFVSEVEDMYSLKAMTYNVHQLLHIVKSIYNWGPLWTHSTFPFESANHKLLLAIHSAKGVILQIIRHINIQQIVQILENKLYPNCSILVKDFCQQITSPLTKRTLKISSATYFGTGNSVSRDIIARFNVPKNILMYSKMVLKGCLFSTSEKINKRSCNYYAQLANGKFIKILHFLADNQSKQELTICKIIQTRPNNYASIMQDVIHMSEEVTVQTNEIVKPCVFIKIKDSTYMIPVPNTISH